MTFDDAEPGVRKLAEVLEIDLGGDGPARIRRGADGIYRGDFCLDTRALCRSQHVGARIRADGMHTVTIFAGREVLRREQARLVDLVALWKGEPVMLTSTSPVADTIDPLRTLVITGDDVIKNTSRTFTPCGENGPQNVPQPTGTRLGKWTFGRLMKLLAGSTDPKAFLKSWILQLDPRPPTATSVNTFPISPRTGLRPGLVVPWCKASSTGVACDEKDDATIEVTPDTAPFRLLAIVNRIDLAEVFLYGPPTSSSAGELRFVFSGQNWNDCSSNLNFFVILEYEVKKSTCDELTKWAQSWVALGGLEDTAYLDALDALVESVVAAPTGTVRLRTSEAGFVSPGPPDGKPPWVMRQFEWDKKGAFIPTTLNRTPDVSFQVDPGLPKLKTWITGREADVDFDRHEIPDLLPDGNVPFAAGEARMFPADPPAPGTFWRIPGADTLAYPDMQHHFSLNTCPACHSGETGTNAVHVRSQGGAFGAVKLSAFLTGGPPVDDPRGQTTGTKTVQRTYDDLTRRKQVLACIATGFGTPCLCQAMLQRISMPH